MVKEARFALAYNKLIRLTLDLSQVIMLIARNPSREAALLVKLLFLKW
jgi:hypothetical protein